MNLNSTKKLTEAALLSSLFVVSTIVAVGSGFGYGIYLDFIVPIFFCIICLKCEMKYTMLSGVTSLFLVSLVLGNIGIAIWASQSITLGIMCGYLMMRKSTIVDDMVYGSILGVILMVLIDIYASQLIGYSFMKEFQGYANYLNNREYVDLVYYILISLFPLGTIFSVYYLSLILGKKLRVLNYEANKKLKIISNFKSVGRFICCSRKIFYTSILYIVIIELMQLTNIKIDSVYLKTITISIEYLCIYFVLRDSYTSIQNYVLSKYNKILYLRIIMIITAISLIIFFRISSAMIIILAIFIDKRINIIVKQIDIINNYANQLVKR